MEALTSFSKRRQPPPTGGRGKNLIQAGQNIPITRPPPFDKNIASHKTFSDHAVHD